MFVDAEDLLHDQHDGERPVPGRHRPVAGDGALGDGDLDLAGDEALVVGLDCLGGDGLHGQREPRRQGRDHERPARQVGGRGALVHYLFVHSRCSFG